MAQTDTFEVTTTWQAAQLDGEDIANGVYSVFSKTSHRVGTIIAQSLPTAANGHLWLDEAEKADKFNLSGDDRWYLKTDTGTVNVTIVKS